MNGDTSIAAARRFFSRGLQSWSNTLQTISRQALIVMDQFSTLEYRLPNIRVGNGEPFEKRLALILKQIASAIDNDNSLACVTNLFNMAPSNNATVNNQVEPSTMLPMSQSNTYSDFLGYDFSNGGSLSDTFGESPATGGSNQSFDWSAFIGMFTRVHLICRVESG